MEFIPLILMGLLLLLGARSLFRRGSTASASSSLSFKLGKAWGRLSGGVQIAVIVVLLLAVGSCMWKADREDKARAARDAQQRAEAAAVEQRRREAELAEVTARLERQRVKCTAERAAILAESRAALARGALDGAADAVRPCVESLPDDAGFKAAMQTAEQALDRRATQRAAALAASEKARKRREGVSIGMSQEDVLASSWGKPRKINRTTNAYGTDEQWVYDGGYLYFHNGVLRTIQN
jgi:hypothetical protein